MPENAEKAARFAEPYHVVGVGISDPKTLEEHLNFYAEKGYRLLLGPVIVGDPAHFTSTCFIFERVSADCEPGR